MKKVKKLMALLLAVIMVMGMSVTATAADAANTETATLTIEGITGNATVTLYQIAQGEYSGEPDGSTFTGFEYANGVVEKDILEPTPQKINEIAQKLMSGQITALNEKLIVENNVTSTFTYNVTDAGSWIATITESEDGKVYNPILLSASYDNESKLVGGTVGVGNTYTGSAVAKSSEPTVDKEITGGTTTDTSTDEKRDTASVGDRIQYTVDVTMPSYPQNATNKTLFLKDKMSDGLRFEYDSLNIVLMNGEGKGPEVTRTVENGKATYKISNGNEQVAIAEATQQKNGFYMNFDYDKLYINNDTGAVYIPQVTYSAVVTDEAVVGNAGNANKVTLEYSNNPNQGDTWDDSSKDPSEDPDFSVVSKEDTETVYTYQIAFKKSTEDESTPLEGAVFGVYTDEKCKNPIDIVKTNKDGIAVSTKVEAGEYWVKELHAPDGYTLNEKAYGPIAANQTSATKTVIGITRTYTSEKSGALDGENAEQVGWLKDEVFYSMDTFDQNSLPDGVTAAYLKSETKNVSEETRLDNAEGNQGTAVFDQTIKNTKMASLPSTGGIGTTIFTVAGCLIMIAAVGLFFASRKKR